LLPQKLGHYATCGIGVQSANSSSVMGCVRIALHTAVLVSLAEQVLLSDTRKEAALDLHSPISTSHNKPFRQADWPLASPFLTFLPFASFELWPQKWGRFFCVRELIAP
jgi:hypothetical protein